MAPDAPVGSTSRFDRLRVQLGCLVSSLVLVACGGGSGADPAGTATTAPGATMELPLGGGRVLLVQTLATDGTAADAPRAGVQAAVPTPLPAGTVERQVEAGVPTHVVAYTVLNTLSCAYIEDGSITVTRQPTHGGITVTHENVAFGGTCAGTFPAVHARYTWTDAGAPPGTGDFFSLHFVSTDGVYAADSNWLYSLAAPPPPPPPPPGGSPISYVALGDSYSSGEGVGPYRDASDTLFEGCHRSTRAYPTLVTLPGRAVPLAAAADATVDFIACSGATTDNVRADGDAQHPSEPTQLAPVRAVDATRDLVTITIGGNDAQFARILVFCLAHGDCDGLQPFVPYSDLRLGDFAPLLIADVANKVLDIHRKIRAATPNAATLVLGYPILLEGTECVAASVPGAPHLKLSASEQVFLRKANQQLNDAIEASAALAGVHFVSVANAFAGHGVCAPGDAWINGVVVPDLKTIFHPTARGQSEYARAANAYLQAASVGWPFGYLPSGLPRNPPATGTAARARTGALAAAPGAASLPSFGDLGVVLAGAPSQCREAKNLIVPGMAARLTGAGFAPNEPLAVSLVTDGSTWALGTVNAGADGTLDASVPIPADVAASRAGVIEVLGSGRNGKGLLLIGGARVEPSATVDRDGDGVPDLCDNCSLVPNPGQEDTDQDGYGNACDADLDNNGIVNTLDLALFKLQSGRTGGGLSADFDGNGRVDDADLSRFKALFGKPPGPSGVAH